VFGGLVPARRSARLARLTLPLEHPCFLHRRQGTSAAAGVYGGAVASVVGFFRPAPPSVASAFGGSLAPSGCVLWWCSVSLSSSVPVPPRVALALSALRAAFPALPAGGCLARLVVVPGLPASLVSVSGAVLVPSAWRLVSSVLGSGGWFVLSPVLPPASQPALF
jgi:hypothetical protein